MRSMATCVRSLGASITCGHDCRSRGRVLHSGGQCREPLWRVSLNEPPSPSKPPHPSLRPACILQPSYLPLYEKTQGQRLRATAGLVLTEERGAGLSVELSDTRRRGSAISGRNTSQKMRVSRGLSPRIPVACRLCFWVSRRNGGASRPRRAARHYQR